MPLNFNSTSVPSSGSVVYNGVSLSTLKQGSVVVWNKMPEFLYNAGNQYTSWTGGWQQKDTYMSHADYWYGNTPGSVSGLNGTLTIQSNNMKSFMSNGSSPYQGVLISTISQIDITPISSLTATFTASEMWGGGYASLGVTKRFENKYQPISATGGVCSRIKFNTTGPHTVTLNTSALSGMYYVCFTACIDSDAQLSTYLQSIKCS